MLTQGHLSWSNNFGYCTAPKWWLWLFSRPQNSGFGCCAAWFWLLCLTFDIYPTKPLTNNNKQIGGNHWVQHVSPDFFLCFRVFCYFLELFWCCGGFRGDFIATPHTHWTCFLWIAVPVRVGSFVRLSHDGSMGRLYIYPREWLIFYGKCR